MKLVVLSDSHGASHRIERVLSLNKDCDAVLFLGDGLADLYGVSAGLVSVRGNCDMSYLWGEGLKTPSEQIMTFDGFRFLMVHGHTLSVKSGIERAMKYAFEAGADVLLYGHTHERCERYFPVGSELCGTVIDRPMYAFNPGSIGSPRDGAPSFGVIEIRNGQMLFSHGELK